MELISKVGNNLGCDGGMKELTLNEIFEVKGNVVKIFM